MFGSRIGPMELIVILAVALIIFGPAKLPELGRSIGRGIREFRQATREIGQNIRLDEEDEEKPKQS